jgi:cytochrome c peroxidase
MLAVGLLLAAWLPASADLNPMEQVGKDLFFDTYLSTPPGMACAACHAPNTAFAGPVLEINAHGAVYPGVVQTRFGNRKPPTSAYASFSPDFHYDPYEGLYVGGMFWDGRALNTIEQAKGPFLNPVEMNNPNQRSVIIKVLKSDYAELFQQVYMEWWVSQLPANGMIPDNAFNVGNPEFIASAYQFVAEAIASYEASSEVNQFSSKYDAYLAGTAMLTDMEMWGLELFEGKAMCNACHISEMAEDGSPPLFTDYTYDNLGVPKNPENPWYTMPPGFNPEGADWVDYGLGAVVGEEDELGKVKVPTLRNVGMRPYEGFVQAYTHNGYFKNLYDVVHFYNTRDVLEWPEPEVPMNVNTDELGDLGLTFDEEMALVAFMETLTDGWTPEMEAPQPVVNATPPKLLLGPPTPNPFRGSARVLFTLPAEGRVNLGVFDVSGRLVRGLITDQYKESGAFDVSWDARDDAGRQVAPGVYFFHLQTNRNSEVQRVVLVP